MDSSELASYEQQLAQVQSALALDEGNADLRSLEAELTNLINLTRQLVEGSGAAEKREAGAATKRRHDSPGEGPEKGETSQRAKTTSADASSSQRKFNAGDECEAKYAGDGRWYPARIVAVGGSQDDPAYTILFKGYGNTEIVKVDSLRGGKARPAARPEPPSAGPSMPSASASTSQPTAQVRAAALETDAERDRKRKRNEKKAERHASKTAEANAMQSSWQKFAKKAEKKGAIRSERSMFKTPDDPLAKVGVVGAGRGMTQYDDRKKHNYDATD